jgi:hypothetical protein
LKDSLLTKEMLYYKWFIINSHTSQKYKL